MIYNLNYNMYYRSLSDTTWEEVAAISKIGLAPLLFSVGETKDGATLIKADSSGCVFSLGVVGEACYRYGDYPYGTMDGYVSIIKTGWYNSTQYAEEHGTVTLRSLERSLPSDMLSVMKTVRKECVDAGTGDQRITSYYNFKLYPPNVSEAKYTYSQYMPDTKIWTRDGGANHISPGYNTVSYWYGFYTYDKTQSVPQSVTNFGDTTYSDNVWISKFGTETLPLVVLFEV